MEMFGRPINFHESGNGDESNVNGEDEEATEVRRQR
jgi:hypothetical protein